MIFHFLIIVEVLRRGYVAPTKNIPLIRNPCFPTFILFAQSFSIQPEVHTGVKRIFQVPDPSYMYDLPLHSWLPFKMPIRNNFIFTIIDYDPGTFANKIYAFFGSYKEKMEKVDKRVKVQEFASLYYDEEKVATSWRQVELSNMKHEENMILEPCSK